MGGSIRLEWVAALNRNTQFLKVKLIKNRSLFTKSTGKIKFQYSTTD
jgi:hypothetical protein